MHDERPRAKLVRSEYALYSVTGRFFRIVGTVISPRLSWRQRERLAGNQRAIHLQEEANLLAGAALIANTIVGRIREPLSFFVIVHKRRNRRVPFCAIWPRDQSRRLSISEQRHHRIGSCDHQHSCGHCIEGNRSLISPRFGLNQEIRVHEQVAPRFNFFHKGHVLGQSPLASLLPDTRLRRRRGIHEQHEVRKFFDYSRPVLQTPR